MLTWGIRNGGGRSCFEPLNPFLPGTTPVLTLESLFPRNHRHVGRLLGSGGGNMYWGLAWSLSQLCS